jgi:hypothetical protein
MKKTCEQTQKNEKHRNNRKFMKFPCIGEKQWQARKGSDGADTALLFRLDTTRFETGKGIQAAHHDRASSSSDFPGSPHRNAA